MPYADWWHQEIPPVSHRNIFIIQRNQFDGGAKEWAIEHLAGYLFKPIHEFCCIIIGRPIVKGIWRWASKPVRNVNHPVQSYDDKSNPATSGAPSEVGDGDFTIPICKSDFVAKLQSSVDILRPRRSNETAKPTSLMKFDGCASPPRTMRYLNGTAQLDLWDPCSRLYDAHVRSVKCFVRQCREAGFQPHV